MDALKVAVIGDQFLRSKVFEDAIRARIDRPLEIVSKDLDWPEVPFFSSDDGPAGSEIREYSGSPEDVRALVEPADVLVTHLAPVTEGLLAGCGRLKFIGVSRGGPTNVNMQAAKARDIVVCNVPGRNASAVAEFTIGAILANTRLITLGHAGLSAGVWRGDLYRYDLTGEELSMLTVGLVGYGHIGQRVARLLKPFGCRILVCDPYVKLTLTDRMDGVEQMELDEMLPRCDVVSLHARVTPETIGILSARRIEAMKAGAVLINSARGSLVDQPALVAALKSGHLGGAALDTFAVEPPHASEELLSLPNVTLTPHIAGASRRVASFAAEMITRDLERFLSGRKMENACF